jgi:EAL domain-containing protein (putative c-di-GMP-specific phosphodiesterase class I)
MEALLRWRHPVHGMIPPDRFIPVAEETGLIVPLGNFVLHRALQAMNNWRKEGATIVPMSVNVAPGQLRRGELHPIIAALLKTHDIPADMLQLEMTERVMFDGSQLRRGEASKDTMSRLRDLGVKIAIDDFGTGYSSLSYLKTWRVDTLKIDRSFVRDLVTDSSDLAIVNAIVAMARHMNIEVVAEGIESYQQVDSLLKLGCNVGQGFLFAKPMPASECEPWLRPKAATKTVEEEVEELLAFTA